MDPASVLYVAVAKTAVPIRCGAAMIAPSGCRGSGRWLSLALLLLARRRPGR